jgi:uncharacterized protein (DUF362 family)
LSSNFPYLAYISKANRDLKKSLLDGLEFIGFRRIIKKDSTVFIKPNFTFTRHQRGVTTSPELLKCLLETIKDRSSTVIVGESDGGNHSYKAEEAFEGHHMYKICKETGAELVNLSKLESVIVEDTIQGKTVRVQLPKLLLGKVECLISAPVMKVHVITGVSIGIKNLWGCYPDTMRCLHHRYLDRKLALIVKRLSPKITVVDGLYALDKHGPMFGDPLKMNLILTSNNVVAADTLGAAIMDVPIRRARHIMVAEKEGIGTTDLAKVEVNVDWKRYMKHFEIRRTLVDRLSSLLFHGDIIARLVMTSPFTPLIYGVAGKLRSPDEKRIASQLGARKTYM